PPAIFTLFEFDSPMPSIVSLSLHDALPISSSASEREHVLAANEMVLSVTIPITGVKNASYEVRHKQAYDWPLVQAAVAFKYDDQDRKSTRLNSSHVSISYAVFCLKKQRTEQ